ncbi:MAG: TlpA disulfide reductase family protein [Peptococcaceae bacterium]|nr:TlpA disulfide reductase family protein [Peptococcaceae bacterium]
MTKHFSTKLIALGLAAVLAAGSLAGCGQSGADGTSATSSTAETITNDSADTTTMQTIRGKEIDLSKTTLLGGSMAQGFGVVKPESWQEVPEDQIFAGNAEGGMSVGYVPEAAVAETENIGDETLSNEERVAIYEAYQKAALPVAAILAVADGEKIEDNAEAKAYDKTKQLASANGYSYYLASNTSLPDDANLSDSDKTQMQALIDAAGDLADNLILFPPESEESGEKVSGDLSSFETTDLDGKTVDQSIFADYDLTMVNIWATWCSACIEEMPELEILYKNLPEGVNMISICGDAADEKEMAEKILKESKASFQTLVANDGLNEHLLNNLSGYPTTIFVDKNGKIVGDAQLGAPGSDVVEGYQALIKDRLAEVQA